MATISYPAYGNGGLTAAQWSTMYSYPDGITNDYTGTGCTTTIVSSGTIARVSPGFVRVNGYTLEVTADEDLAIPTSVGPHYVVASYNPTLNVADGSGNAVPAGPCRLEILQTLDTSGGKAYTQLDRITRSSASGPVSVQRTAQHIGDLFSVASMPSQKLTNPEGNFGGWDHPLGSVCYDRSTGEEYRKTLNSSGGTYWKKQSVDGPFAFPSPSALVAQATNEPARYYFTDNGGMVHFEGTLKRSTGANLVNGADVTLGTMPAGARPLVQWRGGCTVKLGTGWDVLTVTVRASDGLVILYDPLGTPVVDYIDLSAISYRVR